MKLDKVCVAPQVPARPWQYDRVVLAIEGCVCLVIEVHAPFHQEPSFEMVLERVQTLLPGTWKSFIGAQDSTLGTTPILRFSVLDTLQEQMGARHRVLVVLLRSLSNQDQCDLVLPEQLFLLGCLPPNLGKNAVVQCKYKQLYLAAAFADGRLVQWFSDPDASERDNFRDFVAKDMPLSAGCAWDVHDLGDADDALVHKGLVAFSATDLAKEIGSVAPVLERIRGRKSVLLWLKTALSVSMVVWLLSIGLEWLGHRSLQQSKVRLAPISEALQKQAKDESSIALVFDSLRRDSAWHARAPRAVELVGLVGHCLPAKGRVHKMEWQRQGLRWNASVQVQVEDFTQADSTEACLRHSELVRTMQSSSKRENGPGKVGFSLELGL